MGKRRKGFKEAKKGINALQNAGSSDEEGDLDAILDDEIDRYNNEKEGALKRKGGKGKVERLGGDSGDEEEEVYGLNLESSEEEDDGGPTFDASGDELGDEDDEDDDDEEKDSDDEIFGKKDNVEGHLPDSRAWGKKAKIYHSTDYVDQDFGGMEGEDAERAELEEQEAKAIQKRLTAELDESDFMDFMPVKKDGAKKKDVGRELLKLDLSNLSVSEKRKLIERECPEIPSILDDYNEKLKALPEIRKLIEAETRPVLRKYYETKYQLYTNYCINVSFLLYQRSTNPSQSAGHPCVKRILQYRKLIEELNNFNVKKIASKKTSSLEFSALAPVAKKRKVQPIDGLQPLAASTVAEAADEGEEGITEKRKITYAMAKNKGLMPHRKKEQRNPRVKHKEKFRKAKIRRKGQVRTARTEKQRYGGESTGIKTHVTKSIKLK